MMSRLPFEFDLLQWIKWTVPVIGVCTAGLALIMGRAYLRWRLRPPPPPRESAPSPDPFTHGSATNRRAALRRKGGQIKVLVSDAEARQDPCEGWVLDRSMGGLRISISQEIAVDSILRIRPHEAPIETPWIQVQVTNCSKKEEYWEIGCKFERTPPYSVLLMFG